MGVPEKIKAIQDEIHRTQLNKATEHHIGLLKAKIAKLKREQEADAIKKSSKKSKRGSCQNARREKSYRISGSRKS